MRKGIIIFNAVVVLSLALGLGFLARAFYLGTPEMHEDLRAELPWSFLIRFITFFSVGAFVVLLLAALTWIFNTSVIKENPLSQRRILLPGLLVIALAVFVGCMCFFRIVC